MKPNSTHKKIIFISLFFLFISNSAFSQKTVTEYFNGLQSSYTQKKYDSMLYYAQTLDTLRPNHPTVLNYLALAHSLNKDSKQTEKTLQKLSLINADNAILKNEELISSLKKSQLKRLQKLWSKQNEKVENSKQVFLLPARHIEGLTFIEKNKIAFACINKPAIGFVNKTDTAYLEMKMPVMNLFYEKETQKLWGVMSELENSSLYKEENKGKAAIFCIDGNTNEIIFEYELSDSLDHVLGEIKQGKNGKMYCTDSQNPIVYVWNEESQKLDVKWTNPKWRSLQGIAFSDDGKWAFVADYSSTIYQINIQTGKMKALEASKALTEKGISAEVINLHTIKPLDAKAIIDSVSKTKCIVTAEEHNHLGGLGESVARVLSQHLPTPQEFVATNDTFGESGTPAQLMEKYGLNSDAIVKAWEKVIKRK